MILLCGIASEPPVALAIAAADAAGVPYVVWNQRQSAYYDLVLDVSGGRSSGHLWVGEREWSMEQFSGVYNRLIETHVLPENRPRGRVPPDPTEVARSVFLHEVLNLWLELAECRVVNRASAMSSNISKPYQAQLIQQSEFKVPATLVTNEPEEALEFLNAYGRVVYKSISSVRSIVRELTAADRTRLERIRDLPTQFQSFVEGTNIRVHVVGSQVLATEIATSAIDYRYARRDALDVHMRSCDLPPFVASSCRTLASRLELPFCGIDLKRTPDGDYYCFEVNPSPAYSYYEEHTGQPIAEALVRFLAGWD